MAETKHVEMEFIVRGESRGGPNIVLCSSLGNARARAVEMQQSSALTHPWENVRIQQRTVTYSPWEDVPDAN